MIRITSYKENYFNLKKPTYLEIINIIDSELLPLGFTKEELGLSEDGGFMIYGYKYGDFSKPTFWLDANIHGSEWQSVYFTKDFIKKVISEDFYDKMAVASLKNTFSFYYIPSVNPYGFENNQYNNVNLVNLSRNFDNMWEQYVGSEQGKGNTYKGLSVESEAETRVIRDKFLEIKPYVAINAHTTSGGSNGIDSQNRFKWNQVLMSDISKSSKLSIRDAGVVDWNTQYSPQAASWYGLKDSKEGTRTISTVFEHQSDTHKFNYGVTTLFILAFTVLNYYKNGKMTLDNLKEIK